MEGHDYLGMCRIAQKSTMSRSSQDGSQVRKRTMYTNNPLQYTGTFKR